MNERQKRLIEVYEHLRRYLGIHTKTGFAEAVHYGRTSMSAAMNGDEKYLTDSLFKNICAAFPGVFNLEYLLTGNGILITPEEDAKNEMIRIDHEQINKSIDVNSLVDKAVEIAVSSKNETINVFKSQMADLRIQLVEKDKTIEDKNKLIQMLQDRVCELENYINNQTISGPLEKYPFPIGVADDGSVHIAVEK